MRKVTKNTIKREIKEVETIVAFLTQAGMNYEDIKNMWGKFNIINDFDDEDFFDTEYKHINCISIFKDGEGNAIVCDGGVQYCDENDVCHNMD